MRDAFGVPVELKCYDQLLLGADFEYRQVEEVKVGSKLMAALVERPAYIIVCTVEP
jgi:hypothetical protein